MNLQFQFVQDSANNRILMHVVDTDDDDAEHPEYGVVTIDLNDISVADLANVGEIKLQKMKVCDSSSGMPKQRTVYGLFGSVFQDTDDPA